MIWIDIFIQSYSSLLTPSSNFYLTVYVAGNITFGPYKNIVTATCYIFTCTTSYKYIIVSTSLVFTRFLSKKCIVIAIPKASEIEDGGLYLGDVQKKMMEKIEELTLYIIQQNKILEVQNERIIALENKLKK